MDEDIFALFIGLVAVVLGSMVVLIPIAGLTARFALRSWIDRVLSLLESRQSAEMMQAAQLVKQLERRVALLEQEVQLTSRQLQELTTDGELRPRLAQPVD